MITLLRTAVRQWFPNCDTRVLIAAYEQILLVLNFETGASLRSHYIESNYTEFHRRGVKFSICCVARFCCHLHVFAVTRLCIPSIIVCVFIAVSILHFTV